VGETAENQRKTREKTKVAENQVFWLDFCAKNKDCVYPLRIRFHGISSAILCSLAGRYDNPIPTRFLAPSIDTASNPVPTVTQENRSSNGRS
jgi:hypothetical protein